MSGSSAGGGIGFGVTLPELHDVESLFGPATRFQIALGSGGPVQQGSAAEPGGHAPGVPQGPAALPDAVPPGLAPPVQGTSAGQTLPGPAGGGVGGPASGGDGPTIGLPQAPGSTTAGETPFGPAVSLPQPDVPAGVGMRAGPVPSPQSGPPVPGPSMGPSMGPSAVLSPSVLPPSVLTPSVLTPSVLPTPLPLPPVLPPSMMPPSLLPGGTMGPQPVPGSAASGTLPGGLGVLQPGVIEPPQAEPGMLASPLPQEDVPVPAATASLVATGTPGAALGRQAAQASPVIGAPQVAAAQQVSGSAQGVGQAQVAGATPGVGAAVASSPAAMRAPSAFVAGAGVTGGLPAPGPVGAPAGGPQAAPSLAAAENAGRHVLAPAAAPGAGLPRAAAVQVRESGAQAIEKLPAPGHAPLGPLQAPNYALVPPLLMAASFSRLRNGPRLRAYRQPPQPELTWRETGGSQPQRLVAFTDNRPVPLDLAPHTPRVACWRLDDTEALLVTGETEATRAAGLHARLMDHPFPLAMLEPGEGFATWEGSPVWLRLAGIHKPASLGVLLAESTPARLQVLRLEEGWEVTRSVPGDPPAAARVVPGQSAGAVLARSLAYGFGVDLESFAAYAEIVAADGLPQPEGWRVQEAWAAALRAEIWLGVECAAGMADGAAVLGRVLAGDVHGVTARDGIALAGALRRLIHPRIFGMLAL